MDFIIYPPSRRGQQPYSSELEQYLKRLNSNVESFNSHYEQNRIVFPNQHALSRVCNLINEFFGDTPLDTYHNIKVRLPILCGSLGIVHQQPRCETIPIIGNSDVLAYKETKGVVWAGNYLKDLNSLVPLTIIDHNASALSCDYYLEPQDNIMGLWYIDLALFAAIYHQSALNELDHHRILTNVVYRSNIKRLLDIATANNIEYWVKELDVNTFNTYTPYQEYDLAEYGNRLKSSWIKYFSKFHRSGVADLADNGIWQSVSSPTGNEKINDYYVDHLMWVSAFVDVRYFKRIKSINDTIALDIPFKTVEKLPERLLTDNRRHRLTMSLPDDVSHFVNAVLQW